MARLRIRIELSHGGLGVPLQKLASVTGEAQRFLHLLSEDIRIDQAKGTWLGFDFDRESLHFTAEYVGPVTLQQLEAFNAAFDGTTSLRRETIAQFARIAEAIGEDEVIGFGLYPSDEDAEPMEWRCLSRRDALRIAEGIQVLLGSGEGAGQASHLPAVRDRSMGARMFGDRRERSQEPGRLTEYIREVESSLSGRLARVEKKVDNHSGMIEDLSAQYGATEEAFRKLLTTIDNFCGQATRQIERPAPLTEAEPEAVERRGRLWLMAAAALVLGLAVVIAITIWPARPVPSITTEASANSTTPLAAKVVAAAAAPTAPAPAMRIAFEASESSWVSLVDQEGSKLLFRLVQAGESHNFDLPGGGTLRTGNAGGIAVRLNGNPIGPIGPTGAIREIEFKDGGFRIVSAR
ncbi:MAG: DUF4115 domain-containing protein [Acidobacteriia bacterium]|nr:DUF4115 domain-containing protein [Terriglobia bacterium]